MRDYHFLRTPIRGEDQWGLLDLQISEASSVGDPPPDQVYPQTLEISFDVAPATAEVQIAPLWEGSLIFLPDSTAGNPVDPAEVSPANYPNWSVTGDLVLHHHRRHRRLRGDLRLSHSADRPPSAGGRCVIPRSA